MIARCFCMLIAFLGADAMLTVSAPRKHTDAMVDTVVDLPCHFHGFNGIDSLVVLWKRESNKIGTYQSGQWSTDDSRLTLHNATTLREGKMTLRIAGAQPADTGTYTCFVSLRGTDYKTLTLTVMAPYTVVQSASFLRGDKAFLVCRTRGSPQGEMFWLVDGKESLLPSDDNVVALPSGIYEMSTSVTVDDDREYTCGVRVKDPPTVIGIIFGPDSRAWLRQHSLRVKNSFDCLMKCRPDVDFIRRFTS